MTFVTRAAKTLRNLAFLLLLTTCGDDGDGEVGSVVIDPTFLELAGMNDEGFLNAQALSNLGVPIINAAITWSTSNGSVTVTPIGDGSSARVRSNNNGPSTTTVTATSGGVHGTAAVAVTVVATPAIALSSPTLSFSAQQFGQNPTSQSISVANSSSGTLTGLSVGLITYGAGASGWLQASLSSTVASPFATLSLQPTTGSLAPGTYTATVPVQSTVANNSPQLLTVTFTVTSVPLIGLSSNSLSFNANQGGANPSSQVVTITNAGTGTLSGLTIGTINYSGGANGWLGTPTLSSSVASPSATLTLQPSTAGLAAGTYIAVIPVQSSVAQNSPQNVTVTFVVVSAPLIGLSSASLSFNASQGGANPASQAVTITNTGTGTLSGLNIGTISYSAGASGWLGTPTLSSTTASPSATLTVQPLTGTLVAGTYTATIPVQSGVASNSPRNITVTFTVVAGPAIGLSTISLSFNASTGGSNPASQFVTITNTGSGTLTGLNIGTITYSAGAAGWLGTPTLNTTTAPATLTVQPITGALAAGTYTATVPVQSGVASNSPRNITVTFTVTSAPAIALSTTSLSFNAAQGGADPAFQFVTITNSGTGTLSGLNIGTITYSAGASGWLGTPTLSSTTASPSASLIFQPITGGLVTGTYTATIPVQSSVASNSPRIITVTFTVGTNPCLLTGGPSITIGVVVLGSLGGSDCQESIGTPLVEGQRFHDFHQFTLAAATTVTISQRATFDSFLLLYDAGGTLIMFDDDGGEGLNSLITMSLAAGTYFLRTTSFSPFETGTYELGINLPDLITSVMTAPAAGTVGGMIAITTAATNLGGATTTPFHIGFYFSTDATITTSDVFSGWWCEFGGGIGAGSTINCGGDIGVPAGLAPGTYFVGGIADVFFTVSEVNEANNVLAASNSTLISALEASATGLSLPTSAVGEFATVSRFTATRPQTIPVATVNIGARINNEVQSLVVMPLSKQYRGELCQVTRTSISTCIQRPARPRVKPQRGLRETIGPVHGAVHFMK